VGMRDASNCKGAKRGEMTHLGTHENPEGPTKTRHKEGGRRALRLKKNRDGPDCAC